MWIIRFSLVIIILSTSFLILATSKKFIAIQDRKIQKTQVNPVLQLFWPEGTGILPDYVSKSISTSVVPITLLTWGEISDKKVESVNIQNISLDDVARLRFVSKYQPWGLSEPWEQHNTERFFILRHYMKLQKIDTIMYVDSDVVILDPSARELPLGCDAVLSMQEDKKDLMKWETTDWVVWAGTSVLSRQVLDDFLLFVEAMYDEPYLQTLRKKRDTSPYVCDMTLWYLYAGSASKELSKRWDWPENPNLPATPQRVLCDGVLNGFDHQHGHLRSDGKKLKTIHYQGGEKNMIGK